MSAESNTPETFSGLGIVLLNISGFISAIVIVGNILLLYPAIKGKENFSNLKFLTIQYILSSILCSIYICIYSFFSAKGGNKPCELIIIFRNCSILPLISCSACIMVVTFLVLKKEYTLKEKSCFLKVIFFICTWIIPIITCIPLSAFKSTSKEENNANLTNIISSTDNTNNTSNNNIIKYFCDITCAISYEHKPVPSIFTSIIYGIYSLVALLFSINIIWGICKIKNSLSSDVQTLTSKVTSKVIKFIIGIIIFILLHWLSVNQGLVDKEKSDFTKYGLAFIIFFLCLMNPIMVYLFVWTKKFKTDFISSYSFWKQRQSLDSSEMSNQINEDKNLEMDQENYDDNDY